MDNGFECHKCNRLSTFPKEIWARFLKGKTALRCGYCGMEHAVLSKEIEKNGERKNG